MIQPSTQMHPRQYLPCLFSWSFHLNFNCWVSLITIPFICDVCDGNESRASAKNNIYFDWNEQRQNHSYKRIYVCARYEFSIAKHLYVSHCLIWLKCGLNAISLFMPFKMRWISIYLYLTYVRTDKWRWWRRCEWKRICTCSRIRTQSIHFSFENNPIERPIVFGP